jgi:hypothetical protein
MSTQSIILIVLGVFYLSTLFVVGRAKSPARRLVYGMLNFSVVSILMLIVVIQNSNSEYQNGLRKQRYYQIIIPAKPADTLYRKIN